MRHHHSRLRRIVHTLRRVDQFAHLQCGRPHGSLSSRNRPIPVSVVKQLVRNERAPKDKFAQFDAANVEAACVASSMTCMLSMA